MKFPTNDSRGFSGSDSTPDVTAQVMKRLGFHGVDGTSDSIRKARKVYLVRRAGLFMILVSSILVAAMLERQLSMDAPALGDASGSVHPELPGHSGLNALSALQAPFERINSSLSAAEALDEPSFDSSVHDESFESVPLQGPILVPGSYGDAIDSLTSS